MILRAVSIGSLRLEDADSEGFHLIDTDANHMWLSYEQLDDLVAILTTLRDVNASEETR